MIRIQNADGAQSVVGKRAARTLGMELGANAATSFRVWVACRKAWRQKGFMSVDTYTNVAGQTVVRLHGGCTDKLIITFENRKDALALLKALRKRVRR